MTDEEFRALKATFPWTERLTTLPHRQGGIVQVIDCRGSEVPLFTMTKFLAFITTRLSQPQPTPQPQETPE